MRCTRGSEPDPADDVASNGDPQEHAQDPPEVDKPEPPTDDDLVAASYEQVLTALADAMEAGDPEWPKLAERADGQGLVNAQAMVVSLLDAGRSARDEFVPSIETLTVDGDGAVIGDCYRVDLVEFDRDSATRSPTAAVHASRSQPSCRAAQTRTGW